LEQSRTSKGGILRRAPSHPSETAWQIAVEKKGAHLATAASSRRGKPLSADVNNAASLGSGEIFQRKSASRQNTIGNFPRQL
jgi:hypothetical protein